MHIYGICTCIYNMYMIYMIYDSEYVYKGYEISWIGYVYVFIGYVNK